MLGDQLDLEVPLISPCGFAETVFAAQMRLTLWLRKRRAVCRDVGLLDITGFSRFEVTARTHRPGRTGSGGASAKVGTALLPRC